MGVQNKDFKKAAGIVSSVKNMKVNHQIAKMKKTKAFEAAQIILEHQSSILGKANSVEKCESHLKSEHLQTVVEYFEKVKEALERKDLWTAFTYDHYKNTPKSLEMDRIFNEFSKSISEIVHGMKKTMYSANGMSVITHSHWNEVCEDLFKCERFMRETLRVGTNKKTELF